MFKRTKRLSFDQVCDILIQCSAVIVDDDAVVYPVIEDDDGVPSEIILHWNDAAEGLEWEVCLEYCGPRPAVDEDGNIYMQAMDGNEVKLTPLYSLTDLKRYGLEVQDAIYSRIEV